MPFKTYDLNIGDITDLSGMFKYWSGVSDSAVTTSDECVSGLDKEVERHNDKNTKSVYLHAPTNLMDNITINSAPMYRDIIYIHKTNCPNCGGLLDGDEHNPYVRCQCCGAKVWSEREVS